uniref:Uncharacterized protein n=1 Tax=Anguilla anguilla TaxID=7936 RepID=A0A0E9V849_ANGAN
MRTIVSLLLNFYYEPAANLMSPYFPNASLSELMFSFKLV